MKKTLATIIIACLLLAPLPAFASDITIDVNDEPLYTDTPPLNRDGRVYIPLRFLFERAGATVEFFPSPRNNVPVIKINKSLSHLTFTPGVNRYGIGLSQISEHENVDLYSFERAEGSFIEFGRTYIPLRLCAELLGADVQWDGKAQKVIIKGTFDAFTPPADAHFYEDEDRAPFFEFLGI